MYYRPPNVTFPEDEAWGRYQDTQTVAGILKDKKIERQYKEERVKAALAKENLDFVALSKNTQAYNLQSDSEVHKLQQIMKGKMSKEQASKIIKQPFFDWSEFNSRWN